MMEQKEYYAFISYKREDEQWAKWLQHRLEHYKLPSNLNGRTDLPREIRPVFRDTSELNPGNLPQQIHDALAASRHLIVVCSPRSAQSEWVNLEIKTFIAMGKQDCIIPFIIDGEPFAKDPAEECFPPAIRNLPEDQELLGANINEMGRDAAAIKTVAQMFGLRFDSLWQRYGREQQRKRALVGAAVTLFVLAVLGVAGYIWRQNTLLTNSRAELQTAYNNLTVANQKTEQERDRANQEKERAEQAEDSIRVQYGIIEQERDRANQERDRANQERNHANQERDRANLERDRANQEKERAEQAERSTREQYDKTQAALWEMMENRARYVAVKGWELINDHNSYLARRLALEVLPDSLDHPNKPLVQEVEMMFREATICDDGVMRHSDGINSVAFSPDGKCIVSKLEHDGTLRIWNAATGEQIEQIVPDFFHSPYDITGNLVYSPDGKVIVSVRHENIYFWDAVTGKQKGEIKTHKFFDCLCVAFSPDGKHLVSGSQDDIIRIWDVETRVCINELVGHKDDVESVAFFPDGKRIVSASGDGTVRIWNAATGKQIKSLKMNGSMAISSDGKYIVSGSWDRTIRIRNVATGRQIGKPMLGHTDDVISVAFSPDGKLVVSGSRDKTIRIWDVATGRQVGKTLVGHTDDINSVTFSPDGRRVLSGSSDSTVRIWDIESYLKQSEQQVLFFDDMKFSLSFSDSSNGDCLIDYHKIFDNKICVVNSEIGSIRNLREGPSEVITSALSPDGRHIASSFRCVPGIQIWDSKTGEIISGHHQLDDLNCLKRLRSSKSDVCSIAYSSDGRWIVSTSNNGQLIIWDAITGEQSVKLSENSGDSLSSSRSVVFSPDGKRVAESYGLVVRVWNVATGELIWERRTGAVHYVAFSSDGLQLFSGSFDGTVRTWDASTGKQIGNPIKVKCGVVTFSPDAKWFASLCDGAIYVQSLVSGKLIQYPCEKVTDIRFTPNGKRIMAFTYDNYVHIIDFSLYQERLGFSSPLQDLINETRQRFKDCELTPEEKKRYYLE